MEDTLARLLQIAIAFLLAFSAALWFALIVWTYRDITTRTRSTVAQIASTLLAVVLFVPGVVVYLLLRPRETLREQQDRAVEDEVLFRELDTGQQCAGCGGALRDDFVFCPRCGAQARDACQSCRRLIEISWAVCPFCGHAHTDDAVEAATQATRQTPAIESPVVTSLDARQRRRRDVVSGE